VHDHFSVLNFLARVIAAVSPSVTRSSSDGADSAARYAGLAAKYSNETLRSRQLFLGNPIDQAVQRIAAQGRLPF
jgi:hypothetical protein